MGPASGETAGEDPCRDDQVINSSSKPYVNKHLHPQLNVLYSNVDSLSNKFCEFSFLVNNTQPKPDIIALTEVKPKNSRYDLSLAELALSGYNMIWNNLTGNTGRGI